MTTRPSPEMSITMPSDRELVVTRVFNAPRKLVFEAFTRPEHLVRWWGPRGYTMPVCEIDLRPGGAYRFVSRGPDGAEYPFKGVYREIAPPERLVYTETWDMEPWSSTETLITAVLEERDGKTTMTSTILYPSTEARDAHIQSGMEWGMRETYERLDELVATMS